MSQNLKIYPCLGYTGIERRAKDGFHRAFFEMKIRQRTC
jgi:hypothetical protein